MIDIPKHLQNFDWYPGHLRWLGYDIDDTIAKRADLRGAVLRGADLTDAVLTDADLTCADYNYITIGIHPAPQGDLITWGKKSGHILKFRVAADVPRSCATTRKFRSAVVETLLIDNGVLTRLEHKTKWGTVMYEVGKPTVADGWDANRWNECSNGIHWFLTREEAEDWNEC